MGGSPHAAPVRDLDVARLGAFAGAALAALLVATGAPAASVVALVPAAAAAAFDLDQRRLPSGWVATTIAVAVLAGLVPAPVGSGASPSSIVVPAMVAAAVVAPIHLAWPAAVGWGDVTYAVALGIALGAAGVAASGPAVSVWWCLASGSALVEAAIRRRNAVAFGPHLFAAAVVVVGVSRVAGSGA